MFYDPDAGTLLGRTAGSWFKILVFYAIYYSLLGVLFWGSVVLLEKRVVTFSTKDPAKPIAKPYLNSRTDQPGMAVYPHSSFREDDENQEFSLSVDQQAKKNDYEKEMKKFLEKYTYDDLKKFFGDNWAEKIPFVKENGQKLDPKCDTENCEIDGNAKVVLDSEKLKTAAKLGNNGITAEPYVFVGLNKVIDFKIQSVLNFDDLKGVPMQNKDFYESGIAGKNQGGHPIASKWITGTGDQCQTGKDKCAFNSGEGAVYFNCFPCDLKAKTPSTFLNADSPFAVYPIHPYIVQEHYTWSGYSKTEIPSYTKPFAIFQIRNKNATDTRANKYDKSNLFRCNAIADNLDYPYLGNAVTVSDLKDGQGHFTFGFKSPDLE